MSRGGVPLRAAALLGELGELVGPDAVAVVEPPVRSAGPPASATAPSGASPPAGSALGRRQARPRAVGGVQRAVAQRRRLRARGSGAGEHALAAPRRMRTTTSAPSRRSTLADVLVPGDARPRRELVGHRARRRRDLELAAGARRVSSAAANEHLEARRRARGRSASTAPVHAHLRYALLLHRLGQRRVALRSPGQPAPHALEVHRPGAASGRRSPSRAAPRPALAHARVERRQRGEVAVVVRRAAPRDLELGRRRRRPGAGTRRSRVAERARVRRRPRRPRARRAARSRRCRRACRDRCRTARASPSLAASRPSLGQVVQRQDRRVAGVAAAEREPLPGQLGRRARTPRRAASRSPSRKSASTSRIPSTCASPPSAARRATYAVFVFQRDVDRRHRAAHRRAARSSSRGRSRSAPRRPRSTSRNPSQIVTIARVVGDRAASRAPRRSWHRKSCERLADPVRSTAVRRRHHRAGSRVAQVALDRQRGRVALPAARPRAHSCVTRPRPRSRRPSPP